MTQMLAPANSGFADFAGFSGFAGVVEVTQASFIIWMNCTVMDLCSYSALSLQTTMT